MNKFWNLVIKIRDISQQISLKEYGKDPGSEYKTKLLGFISGYFLTAYFIIFQIVIIFTGTHPIPAFIKDSRAITLLVSLLILYFPMRLCTKYLLNKVSHIPLPEEFTKENYNKNQITFFAGFLFGHVLWILIGIFFMAYLRGIPIN